MVNKDTTYQFATNRYAAPEVHSHNKNATEHSDTIVLSNAEISLQERRTLPFLQNGDIESPLGLLLIQEHGPLALLALLHKFESGSPGWKSGLMKEFAGQGDSASAQDFDYDWADESIRCRSGKSGL